METTYQALGFTLMALGVCLVIGGVIWELGKFGRIWHTVTFVVVGVGVVLLGQLLVR